MQINQSYAARPQPYGGQYRRGRMLMGLVFAVGAIFIVRLFYIQVIQHDFYENEATKEHTAKFTIPSSRGEIYARDGNDKIVPLVLNEPTYLVYADPQGVKDAAKIADSLRRIAGGNTIDKFEDGLNDKTKQYVVLAKKLNKQQADLLKAENLAGVGLQEGQQRVYPEGQLASQVLGFVNNEDKGQYGLEEGQNDQLSGTPGQLKAVTDVNGIPLSIGQDNVQTPAVNGTNIVLSIDRNIQLYTEQALKAGLDRVKATRGSAVIINPANGQVMAMANLPTYNPTDFSKVASEDYRVFENATISEPYEPGSVMKSLSMGVGLNEGVVTPETTFVNTGTTKVADATIKNAGNELIGTMNMVQVLQYSYNTGMVFVLRQLGGGDINMAARQKLYQYYTDRYFLGRPTGIGLAGEAKGEVIPPDDPQGGPVRYANMTFGQGISVTMVQELSAFAAAVNGGIYYTPQIISGTLANDKTVVPVAPIVRKSDVLTPSSSETLRNMLQQARSKSSISKNDKKNYFIGGKTGTAQVYDPKTGTYSETNTIGSYLGFGGKEHPEYVIMIRVDDAHIGDFAGSAAAAPIFADISNWLLDYLKIQPKG